MHINAPNLRLFIP